MRLEEFRRHMARFQRRVMNGMQHIVKNIRRVLGMREPRVPDRVYRDAFCAMRDKYTPPEKDGYLQYWMDGLKIKVELTEGKTSFGYPGETLRGAHLSGKDGGHYAVFSRHGNHYTVGPAGPETEVFLCGKKVTTQNEPINPGDKIQVGNFDLTFFRRSRP